MDFLMENRITDHNPFIFHFGNRYFVHVWTKRQTILHFRLPTFVMVFNTNRFIKNRHFITQKHWIIVGQTNVHVKP